MDRITGNSDGSYSWSCPIEIEYHRRDTFKGLGGVLVIVLVILIIHAFAPSTPGNEKDIWVPMIPIGVVLAIALPLLWLQYHASDPHEQYTMTEEYIKTGYGKSSVFTSFEKTKYIDITSGYLELYDGHRRNRIYVPEEDRDFVRDYILQRIPEGTAVHHMPS